MCYTVESHSAEWHSAEGNFIENAIRLSVILIIVIQLTVILLIDIRHCVILPVSFFDDCHSVECNPGESHSTMS